MLYRKLENKYFPKGSSFGIFFSIRIKQAKFYKPVGLLSEILLFLKDDIDNKIKLQYANLLRHLRIDSNIESDKISLSENLSLSEPYRYKNENYTFQLISNGLVLLSKYFRDSNSTYDSCRIIIDHLDELDIYSKHFLKIATRENLIRVYINSSSNISEFLDFTEVSISRFDESLADIIKKGKLITPNLEIFEDKKINAFRNQKINSYDNETLSFMTNEIYKKCHFYTSSGFYSTSKFLIQLLQIESLDFQSVKNIGKVDFLNLQFINFCSLNKVQEANNLVSSAIQESEGKNNTQHFKWLYYKATLHLRYFQPSSPLTALSIINQIENKIKSSENTENTYIEAFILNTKALASFQQSKFIEAKKLCISAISKLENYNDSKAVVEKGTFLFNLSQLYFAQGNFKKAIYYIDKAQKMEPLYPDYYLIKGNYYFQLENFKDALSYYKKFSALGIRTSEFYNNYFLLMLNFNDNHSINVKINEAKLIYPHDNGLMLNISSYLIDNSLLHKAENIIKLALNYNPTDSKLYNNLGRVYHDLKNYKLANKFYSKAIEYDSELIDAYINLSSLHFDLLEINKSEKYLIEAKKIEPENEDVIYNLNFLQKMKDNE